MFQTLFLVWSPVCQHISWKTRSHWFKQEDWAIINTWSWGDYISVQHLLFKRCDLKCLKSHQLFSSLQQFPALIFSSSLMCRFSPVSYHNTMARKVTKFFSGIINLLYFNRGKKKLFWVSRLLYIRKKKISRAVSCGYTPYKLQPLDNRVLSEWYPECNVTTLKMSRW